MKKFFLTFHCLAQIPIGDKNVLLLFLIPQSVIKINNDITIDIQMKRHNQAYYFF